MQICEPDYEYEFSCPLASVLKQKIFKRIHEKFRNKNAKKLLTMGNNGEKWLKMVR